MSGCSGGCGTSSSSNSKGKKSNAIWELENPRDYTWDNGSHAAGATLTLRAVKPLGLTLAGVKAPNILVFNEDPCLKAGSNIVLDNLQAAACMDGIVNCLTATAASALVGTKYEVVTNGAWTGAALDFSGTVNVGFCGTSDSAIKPPIAFVCGTTPLVSNYKGFVCLRPLNSPAIAGVVKVFNGSDTIAWDSSTSSRPPVQGDSIELTDTAIKGTNKAKVLSVATDGKRSIIKLDRAVTGSTRIDNCSTFVSSAAKIADLTFSVICGCHVVATLPASLSSDPNFPAGKSVDCGACMKQGYCYEIICSTPGSSFILSGQIIL